MSTILAWIAARTTARARLRSKPRRTNMETRDPDETPKKMSKSTLLVAAAFIGGLLLLILLNM